MDRNMNDYKKIILDYWNTHKDDAEYQGIVNEESFWFKKASELLEKWKNYDISEERIDSLLSMEYEDIKNSSDEEISKIRELLFELIAYCDAKANKKEQYNPSLRTVAKSGVRQNNWVINLLRWRKSGTASTSVYNAIKYLSNPQSNLTMLSENHRKKFCSEVLQKPYDSNNFCNEVIKWMNAVMPAVELKSDDNRTWLYCNLIYANKDKWLPSNVLGVIARDARGWQEECCNHEYVAFGWDQVSKFSEVKEDLKNLIETNGSFPFYNVANNETNYNGDVVDFVSSDEEYKECVGEWKEKSPASFCDTFSQYGQSGKPAVVFLVRNLKKMEKGYNISQFKFFKDVSPSVKNMVAYTKILSENHSGDNMKEELQILQNKKNIILQGAPGTGKTYNTAALALSVLGIKDIDYGNHDAVMEKYKELLIEFDEDGCIKNDGQIGFVTFHQSMDYEDFVEGIKPIADKETKKVFYDVRPGIFKSLCNKASSLNDSKSFNEAFKKLIEKIPEADEEPFKLQTTKEKIFGLTRNSRENLNLHTGADLKKQGVLTKENIQKYLLDDSSIDYWRGYFGSVAAELKKPEYGYIPKQKPNDTKYVLIIDEINRGNVSKIFGELITLLETDKRKLVGADNIEENRKNQHEVELTLPYSKDKFSVPSNLYIIGTMNTTDRSVGSIDYAVRRRFAFVTLEADESAIENYYKEKDESLKKKAIELFGKVRDFLSNNDNRSNDMGFEDLMVGHSYFMAGTLDELNLKWKYEVIPLLKEYQKDGLLRHSAKIEDILK